MDYPTNRLQTMRRGIMVLKKVTGSLSDDHLYQRDIILLIFTT